jgi:hypothetical protein
MAVGGASDRFVALGGNMQELRVRLVGAASNRGLPGFRVEARWLHGGVPDRRTALSDSAGVVVLEYPGAEERVSELSFRASAPDGQHIAEIAEAPRDVWRLVEPEAPVVSPVSPTVAARDRLSGRAIDASGKAVAAGSPIAILGRVDGATTPQVLLQTTTGTAGYFQGPRPASIVGSAFARVNGRDASAVPLADDGRVAPRVIVIVPSGSADDPCDCGTTPPRTPEPVDLALFPEQFSGDAGGRCVDFTVPSRVVEEIVYFKVVRTTEPEIQGTSTGVRRLAVSTFAAVADLVDAKAAAAGDAAPRLRADVAQRLFSHPDRLTPAVLADAVRDSHYADLDADVRAIAQGSAGRVPMDATRSVDWDDTPTLFEAVTIAHGHLLQYRQVWRADGYSLGDLLYSLPLAPGQKKLVSLLDWSRLEESAREEWTSEEEEMSAFLERDRDVLEIVDSHLVETSKGGSSVNTWGGGGGIGGAYIGTGWGIFAGVAGGGGGSASRSWQDSGRSVAIDGMQSIRDRTIQGASVVRSTRSTVVQTDHQAERAQAVTEVIVNYNHCHALTIEYFEVLRHFTVTHELADVSECLFVPLPMRWFDRPKALRWREALVRYLRDRSLAGGFAAIERVQANWVGYDVPAGSFAEEAPESLEGELWISFIIPRPRDAEDGKYQVDRWKWIAPYLPQAPLELWTSRMNQRNAAERDLVFRKEVAPLVAANLVRRLRFAYLLTDGSTVQVPLDVTLVGQYAEGVPLYVSLRPAGALPAIPREQIQMFRVSFAGVEFPEDARVLVHRGKVRYDAPHLRHLLFSESRILSDLALGDDVLVPTPLSPEELRDPRQDDRELAARLLSHLNDHLEYYHQLLWMTMDPARRYLLLDGFQAPNANGRSVASVVENRLLGIVGNCLVMPVSPGNVLAPPLRDEQGRIVELMEHYAVPPERPIRVTVPTRGVFAEAVQGACNSCETIDDTRLWRFDESPLPDTPVAPEAPTLDSRVQTPVDATPTPGPAPIINIQSAPALPDPLGLSNVFAVLAKSDLFKDVTGLEANQTAALGAYQAALDTAKTFAGYASAAVLQQDLGKNIDRTLARAADARKAGLLTDDQARAVAYGALRGLIGDADKGPAHPLENPSVSEAVDRAAEAETGSVSVTSGDEQVSARFDGGEAGEVVLGAAASTEFETWTRMPVYVDNNVPPALGASLSAPQELDSVADFEAAFMAGVTDQTAKDQTWDNAKDNGWVRKNTADATQLDVNVRYRITIPSATAAFKKPSGTGKVPLVVIVHGNHSAFLAFRPFPTLRAPPSYLGYQELQDHLASLGFASISVDDNVSNWLNQLIEMRGQHVVAAIRDLRKRTRKSGGLKNRIDFKNVILMGHSRGGDGVVRAAQIITATNALAATPAKDKIHVRGVCLLAPTDLHGDPGLASPGPGLTSADTDFFLGIRGTHDGDVHGTGGVATGNGTSFRHYGRATCPKVHVDVDFACHNRFNTVWVDAANWGGALDPFLSAIDVGSVLSEPDHRTLLNDYVGALAQWTVKADPAAAKILDGTTANSVGAQVSLLHQFGGRGFRLSGGFLGFPGFIGPHVIVDSVESAMNDLGQARVLPAAEGVTTFDTSTDTEPGGVDATRMPFATKAVFVPLDARVTTPTTSRYGAMLPVTNLDGFHFLDFDLAVVGDITTEPNLNALPLPALKVRLFDVGLGVSNDVDPLTSPAPHRPPWRNLLTGRNPITGAEITTPSVLYRFETMRVPLASFTGVDLSKLWQIHVMGDSSTGATILIDNIRFTREP